jgi:hypothetical protein
MGGHGVIFGFSVQVVARRRRGCVCGIERGFGPHYDMGQGGLDYASGHCEGVWGSWRRARPMSGFGLGHVERRGNLKLTGHVLRNKTIAGCGG